MNNPENLIKKLQLIPHPEGGYFSESFRDEKNSVSLIYYLLKKGDVSHWHKLKKNEILHFYDGDPLVVYLSVDGTSIQKIILNSSKNQLYHFVIKSGAWFSMESKGEYSLIGCTVSPPFDYEDLELAPKNWRPGKS